MASKFKKTAKSTASSAKSAAFAAFDKLGPAGDIAAKLGELAQNIGAQPNAKQVMESAQQIWLAGLGAFSKAQNEGKKAFDTLVKQGAQIEENTRHVAEATIETAKAQATKTFEAATGKLDKLEQVFETRVHASLNRLGVLTAKDIEALTAQVAELSEAVRALLAQEKKTAARPAVKKAVAKRPAAKKPAAKRR
jgi:poly(hydroxyalkanoate) granule-associated protein